MRLLNTTSGQFEDVPDPQRVRYAILSHTWTNDEQDFDAIAAIQRDVIARSKGEPSLRHTATAQLTTHTVLSHPEISPKIKEACRVALSHGYELLWYDACCIDQSNNTELSESLSAMYSWYLWADVCYVYLVDVPSDDIITLHGSAFRISRWHKRGWTLQELIAPKTVIFLSQEWTFLGTKARLADLLESITGIPIPVLLHKLPVSAASVAQRMSWASSRKTRRVEDEAYALMGIFGVRIRMDYGEGCSAFLRLQKKIMEEIPADQTLFAWGPMLSSKPECPSPASVRRLIEERMAILDTPLTSFQRPARSLFAAYPHDFRMNGAIEPLSDERFADIVWGDSPPLLPPEQSGALATSSEGFYIQLPTVRCPPSILAPRAAQRPYRDCRCAAFECISLALLQCGDDAGNLIALPLCKPPEGAADSSLLVGTRTDTCLDCKRYFRTYALSREQVKALRADVAYTALEIRRDPLQSEFSGSLPLRIRRISVERWCTAALAADGYTVSLRRVARSAQQTSEYPNGHLLTLRPGGSAASPNSVPRIDLKEIEVDIVQGERPDGVSFSVRLGRSGGLRADTVAITPTDRSAPAPPNTSTRSSRFAPFFGRGEVEDEINLPAVGNATPFVLTLRLTPQDPTEPAWTFGGWGQAPYVDFALRIELTTSTGADGSQRRARTV